MQYILYTIGFLVELVAWSAVASLGFFMTNNRLVAGVLGVALFVMVVVLWGVFMAPKAKNKLPIVAYYFVKFVTYSVAIFVLWRASPVAACVFIVVVLVSEPFLYQHAVEVRA